MSEGETELQVVLQARAARLARREGSEAQAGERHPLLRTSLGKIELAVEPSLVLEVVPVQQILALPLAPAALYGLIEVRGIPLAAVDLGTLLGLHSLVYDRAAGLVCGPATDRLVLLVGAVSDLAFIPMGALAPLPLGLARETARFVTGVWGEVLPLDLGKLLADPQLRFAMAKGGRGRG